MKSGRIAFFFVSPFLSTAYTSDLIIITLNIKWLPNNQVKSCSFCGIIPAEYYSLICFAIDERDELVEKFDHDALKFLIKSFREHLNRFFYPRGGYCLRETVNEYSVLFPDKDLDSVEIILEDFASGLKETGIPKTIIRPLADEPCTFN